jgi:hypothetical protein
MVGLAWSLDYLKGLLATANDRCMKIAERSLQPSGVWIQDVILSKSRAELVEADE